MTLLARQDWEKLRNDYSVAFWTMPVNLFNLLLDKVYGPKREGNPGSDSTNTGELDDTDALMFYLTLAQAALAPAEPGIQPQPPDKYAAHAEPGIQPGPSDI